MTKAESLATLRAENKLLQKALDLALVGNAQALALRDACEAALREYAKREWTDPASGGPAAMLRAALDAVGIRGAL
jgi:hypothetical protein